MSPSFVPEFRAACELVLGRARSGDMAQYIRNAQEVLVPELFVAEIANVLWKYVKAKELDLSTSQFCLENALKICDRIVDTAPLIEEALMTSCLAKHPVYDSIYLVLARRNGARLLTLDRRLITLAQSCGVACLA